jgi:hypothetical protein
MHLLLFIKEKGNLKPRFRKTVGLIEELKELNVALKLDHHIRYSQ